MKQVCVYALECPILHAVFYVGLSVNPQSRMNQHKCRSHSKQLREWIAELKAIGHRPTMFILQRTDAASGRGAERKWIRHYSRISPFLLNSRMAGPEDSNITRRRRSTPAQSGRYMTAERDSKQRRN